MSKEKSVLLIFTGGTISMGENPTNGSLSPLDKDAILKLIPELEMLPVNISSVSFNPMIDSSDVEPNFWVKIAETIREYYYRYDGFVILHGTDTMAYSASAVSFMLENLSKPVIFTGSQLPLGMLRSDAKENVMNAIEIAAAYEDNKPVVPEVALFFEDLLMRGNRAMKKSTEYFNAFASFNYPILAKSGVHIKYFPMVIHYENEVKPLSISTHFDNNIAILKLFPGIQESVVQSVLETPHLRGVILESFGAGNAPRAEWLYQRLKAATESGMIIVNVSQCRIGSVEMGRYETSLNLQKAGILSGYDMTIETATTKLMFLLGKFSDPKEVVKYMHQSLRGEVTIMHGK